MAVTNFSPLLGLALPTTGDLSGTWGNTVNVSITALLDSAVAGTTTLSTDVDVTLSTTNGAANQARNAVLLCTGSRSSLKTITAPAQSKAYVVINSTTGGYGVKIVGSGPTTGVTVTNGEKALIAWNGSDFVIISSSVIDLTSEVTGTLPVANGGTGQTSFTNGQLLIGNSSGNTLTKSTLTAGSGVTITNSAGGITIAATGSGSVVFSISPTLTTPNLGTPASGTLSSCTVDGTNTVGYQNIPINSQSTNYTLVLTDSGKSIFHPSTDAFDRTFTIPANASVAYPLGTAISFINMSANNLFIELNSDTMYLSGYGYTGTRTLAQYGSATAIKMTSTTWMISGNGLS